MLLQRGGDRTHGVFCQHGVDPGQREQCEHLEVFSDNGVW